MVVPQNEPPALEAQPLSQRFFLLVFLSCNVFVCRRLLCAVTGQTPPAWQLHGAHGCLVLGLSSAPGAEPVRGAGVSKRTQPRGDLVSVEFPVQRTKAVRFKNR